jgi:hypothetical protein
MRCTDFRNPKRLHRQRRTGAAAMLAMLFLVIFSTLAVGMYAMCTLNSETVSHMAAGEKARSAAESGIRWISWRFVKMPRPRTPVGNITAPVARALWPSIRDSLKAEFDNMLNVGERPLTWDGKTLVSAPIATDKDQGTFVLSFQQHPLTVADPLDARYIRVTSTGRFGDATKSISLDYKIDKKVKFALIGKVPIQLGRNTMVEGPIGMTTRDKFPPIYMLNDFRHLTTALTAKIDSFDTFLGNNHAGYDNRINVHNPDEYAKASAAGYNDYSGDGFIDDYDLFLKEFDKNGDRAITKFEFTNPSNGKLYDPELFTAIDSLGAPFDGEQQRIGFQDGIIDNSDGYTKVRGQITLATNAQDWQANLSRQGQTIHDNIVGPVQGDGTTMTQPVQFGVDPADMFDLSPGNFDTSDFATSSGTAAGPTQTGGGAAVTIQNKTLSSADSQVMRVTNPGNTNFKANDLVLKSDFDAANASLPTTKRATGTNITPPPAVEQTPYGSASYQATYQRPVFRNMQFKNVRIPKGLNALFDNCTFEGVTYVDLTTNITAGGQTTTKAGDGMAWSQRMRSGSFSNTTTLTASNSYGFTEGNNLRFNNCTINGPLTSAVPSAYTHFSNSWEFTSNTKFDNKWTDDSGQTTATMICPQTNIEMGSFTKPGDSSSVLTGVVVAGNLDIRGESSVDGSIIITGDGAGNTTQGWFGPSDASTDPSTPMPEGGYGRLNIRYNPYRPLPDGINIPVDITPDKTTYKEGL